MSTRCAFLAVIIVPNYGSISNALPKLRSYSLTFPNCVWYLRRIVFDTCTIANDMHSPQTCFDIIETMRTSCVLLCSASFTLSNAVDLCHYAYITQLRKYCANEMNNLLCTLAVIFNHFIAGKSQIFSCIPYTALHVSNSHKYRGLRPLWHVYIQQTRTYSASFTMHSMWSSHWMLVRALNREIQIICITFKWT